MTDVLDAVLRWLGEGRRVAIATLVAVERSAPRDPGAALAVDDRGEVAGSVSGGCVEGAVYEEAADVIATGRPRLVTYGISDEVATEFGLTCGGTIHVFIERADAPLVQRLARAIRGNAPVAIGTRMDGSGVGAKLLVDGTGVAGTLGDARLDAVAERAIRGALDLGATGIRAFGTAGEPTGTDLRLFVRSWAPQPDMLIFGAIDFSRAMATAAKFLGYRTIVVDARPIFATRARVPDADDVVVAWPDEYLAAATITRRTAIVVLTHDVKFDIPLLEIALRSQAGYIGAMGSRRTHAERVRLLRERGVGDAELVRVHAPIGLDLGARTPEETAISIAAEIVAVKSGRSGAPLRDGTKPVHDAPSNVTGGVAEPAVS